MDARADEEHEEVAEDDAGVPVNDVGASAELSRDIHTLQTSSGVLEIVSTTAGERSMLSHAVH